MCCQKHPGEFQILPGRRGSGHLCLYTVFTRHLLAEHMHVILRSNRSLEKHSSNTKTTVSPSPLGRTVRKSHLFPSQQSESCIVCCESSPCECSGCRDSLYSMKGRSACSTPGLPEQHLSSGPWWGCTLAQATFTETRALYEHCAGRQCQHVLCSHKIHLSY